jgi:AcrR family transcriptional regulator
MARIAGRIDQAKSEAILDAAVEVMAERGFSASMEAIARRAKVSKQTIYNHYGCKADLVGALSERRAQQMTAPLEAPEAADHPQEALAGFARSLLSAVLSPASVAFLRVAIRHAVDMPQIARAMYEAGPRTSRGRLAEFLAAETKAGRMRVPEPLQAAEFFGGMVIGSYQTAGLLGVARDLSEDEIEAVAQEAAARFLRAYGL